MKVLFIVFALIAFLVTGFDVNAKIQPQFHPQATSQVAENICDTDTPQTFAIPLDSVRTTKLPLIAYRSRVDLPETVGWQQSVVMIQTTGFHLCMTNNAEARKQRCYIQTEQDVFRIRI